MLYAELARLKSVLKKYGISTDGVSDYVDWDSFPETDVMQEVQSEEEQERRLELYVTLLIFFNYLTQIIDGVCILSKTEFLLSLFFFFVSASNRIDQQLQQQMDLLEKRLERERQLREEETNMLKVEIQRSIRIVRTSWNTFWREGCRRDLKCFFLFFL